MFKIFKPNSEFKRNVLRLMTGTSIAQAIPVAMSPVLTRIYSPEEFGLLALYLAVAGVLSVLATARYEFAIMMPEEDEDASDIFWLSLMISTTISIILFIIVFVFDEKISQILGNKEIESWLYLLPVSVFLIGLYQVFNFLNTRNKKFTTMAKSKVTQSTVTVGTQVSVGLTPLVSFGLVAGIIVGQIGGVLYFIGKASKEKKINAISIYRSFQLARKYKNFPLFSTWGAIFDKLALQMPIFVLTKLYSAGLTGQFSLTFRVLNLPMSLVGMAISQVLFQRVVYLHNNQPHKLKAYIIKIFSLLFLSAIPMVVFFYFFGEWIFIFVFGEEWGVAGQMVTALSIAVAIRFAVSPLSIVLAMDHNLKLGTTWQALYLLTLTTTLLWAAQFGIDNFIQIFVAHEVILYLIYFVFILKGTEYMKGDIGEVK